MGEKRLIAPPAMPITDKVHAWFVQAAIDMANVELKYGTFQPLLVLAKQIVAAQTEEIQEFRAILVKEYATPGVAAGGK